MNSLIIKRGLKNVETFKSLSKRLARTDEIVPKPQKKEKKPIKNISSSIKLVPNKKVMKSKSKSPLPLLSSVKPHPFYQKYWRKKIIMKSKQMPSLAMQSNNLIKLVIDIELFSRN